MAYMIMANLGFYECLELSMTIYDGLSTLCQFKGDELLETIIGGLNCAAWDTHGPIILILSLNRLNAFMSKPKKQLFSVCSRD
uniref:ARM repeat superfamily protein n=1 Tax=Steinernema glaseri TaxID=37863 RepID=A0A1I7YTY3_9BILA